MVFSGTEQKLILVTVTEKNYFLNLLFAMQLPLPKLIGAMTGEMAVYLSHQTDSYLFMLITGCILETFWEAPFRNDSNTSPITSCIPHKELERLPVKLLRSKLQY